MTTTLTLVCDVVPPGNSVGYQNLDGTNQAAVLVPIGDVLMISKKSEMKNETTNVSKIEYLINVIKMQGRIVSHGQVAHRKCKNVMLSLFNYLISRGHRLVSTIRLRW